MSVQERNYDDLFEIAIINSKPCAGEQFNWAAFKASEVKEKKDLPSYLIFGPLDEGTLVINEDGWFAQWKDAEQKAKVTVNWRKDTKMYSVSQVWMGIEGSELLMNNLSRRFSQAFMRTVFQKTGNKKLKSISKVNTVSPG